VDDEEPVRQFMARTLEGTDITVFEAEKGAAALQLARQLNGSLSLAVTDVKMPVMDGLQFARPSA
jgi:CheY-like chemotaxis protein